MSSLNTTEAPIPGRPLGLAEGTPAPDFALRDQFGQDVVLSSYAGRKAVLLVFFPWAFSNVCTGEMTGIRDRLADFMTFGSEVLGISTDPAPSRRPTASSTPSAGWPDARRS